MIGTAFAGFLTGLTEGPVARVHSGLRSAHERSGGVVDLGTLSLHGTVGTADPAAVADFDTAWRAGRPG